MMAFDVVDERAPAAKPENLFELIRPIACGSTGEVWLARTIGPEQSPIAVKKLLPHLAQDPEFIRIFLEEVRLAAGLKHPDIARILEFGRSAETAFVAMEYVSGCTLKRVQRQLSAQHKAMPAWLVLSVMIPVCNALHAAHERRILHRDVRPENIMLSMEGETKVLDFGIARAAMTSAIGVQSIPRNLAYTAPELVQHDRTASKDRRTDVYSAGVVLYEMLTGVRPFEGPTEFALARAILEDTPLPPYEAARWVPARLSDIVMRAIARDPGQRLSSAVELGNELGTFMKSLRVVPTRTRLSDFMARLSGQDSDDAPASWSEPIPSSQRVPLPPPCFHHDDVEAAQGLADKVEAEVEALDFNWDDAFADTPLETEPGARLETTDQLTMSSAMAPPVTMPTPPPRIVILSSDELPVAGACAPAPGVSPTTALDEVEGERTMQSARPLPPVPEEEPPASSQPASSVWDMASQRTARTGRGFDRLWQRPSAQHAAGAESRPAALWDRVTAKARSEAVDDAAEAVPSQPRTQSDRRTSQATPESSRVAQAWDRIATRQSREPARLPQLDAIDSFEQGLELVKQRRYVEALELWERAIELDPNNTRLVTNAKRLRERLMREG